MWISFGIGVVIGIGATLSVMTSLFVFSTKEDWAKQEALEMSVLRVFGQTIAENATLRVALDISEVTGDGKEMVQKLIALLTILALVKKNNKEGANDEIRLRMAQTIVDLVNNKEELSDEIPLSTLQAAAQGQAGDDGPQGRLPDLRKNDVAS